MEKQKKEAILREILTSSINQKESSIVEKADGSKSFPIPPVQLPITTALISSQSILQTLPNLPIARPEGHHMLPQLSHQAPEPAQDCIALQKSTPLFALPKPQPWSPFEHLPKQLMFPFTSQLLAKKLHPIDRLPLAASSSTLDPAKENFSPLHSYLSQKRQESPIPRWDEKWDRYLRPFLQPENLFLPPLRRPHLPSLAELHTISCSDVFDIEVSVAAEESGTGYFFAMTLIPKEELQLAPMQQNYYFLIDRSNSIQKERLRSTKNAVRKAISELEGSDTFNIFVFDNKIEKFSSVSLSPTHESLQKAYDFLDKIELGSFFSQPDLFKPLFLTLPSETQSDELHTAILLTDGESLNKKGPQQALLADWTRLNGGSVALHTLSMASDAHLSELELAAAINRGTSLTSTTYRGLKRKLSRLMKMIHTPIAKSLSCKAIARYPSKSPRCGMEIYPQSNLPHLYRKEPYTIVGKAESLDDFVFFLQGRLNEQWIHIKKKISFLDAKQASSSLGTQWTMRKAYHFYERYLVEENLEDLSQANHLLQAYNKAVVLP